MKYLLDTDWLIDLSVRPEALRTQREQLFQEGAATSIIAVAEFLEGAYRRNENEVSLAARFAREFFTNMPVLPVTIAVAERFAAMRAMLRRDGNMIADLDLLIAATAIDAGLVLVTRNNRHFARLPELMLYAAT